MKTIAIVVATLVALNLSCAYCHQEANKSTLECAVVNSLVDCTTANVVGQLRVFEPLVNYILGVIAATGAPIDWPAFGIALGGLGLDVVGCVVAEVKLDIDTPPASMPAASPATIARNNWKKANQAAFDAWWPGWVNQKYGGPVGFRLARGVVR